MFQACAPKAALAWAGRGAEILQQTSGEALFESGHHHGWVVAFWFAEQGMYVLGHHNKARNNEVKSFSDLLQDLKEQVTILRAV